MRQGPQSCYLLPRWNIVPCWIDLPKFHLACFLSSYHRLHSFFYQRNFLVTLATQFESITNICLLHCYNMRWLALWWSTFSGLSSAGRASDWSPNFNHPIIWRSCVQATQIAVSFFASFGSSISDASSLYGSSVRICRRWKYVMLCHPLWRCRSTDISLPRVLLRPLWLSFAVFVYSYRFLS